MNCEECREFVVRGERAEAVDEHAAVCAACGTWCQEEALIMGRLHEAGAAWRVGSMGAAVVGALARRPRRRMVVGRIVRYATAAAVLLIAAGGVYVATRPTPVGAMVEMVREIKERGTVRFVLEAPRRPLESGTFFVSGERMRIELGNGDVVVADAASKRTVLLMPATRQVIAGENGGEAFDLYGLLLQLAEAPRTEELGHETMDGRVAEKFRVQLPASMGALPDAVALVWLDVSTRLPLRVEIPVRESEVQETVVFRDFEFDGVMDASLFDTSPDGYVPFAPQVTTPVIGIEMGMKIRKIGLALQSYMQDHGETVPETIEQLAPYLEESGLVSMRRPSEPIGYVYVKPSLPLKFEQILAYERFAEDSDHVWVVLVEGSVHAKTHAELEALLRAARGE